MKLNCLKSGSPRLHAYGAAFGVVSELDAHDLECGILDLRPSISV